MSKDAVEGNMVTMEYNIEKQLFAAGTEPWASLGTTSTNAPRLRARESPTTTRENKSWDALLPTLTLAPAAYTPSVCTETTRSIRP